VAASGSPTSLTCCAFADTNRQLETAMAKNDELNHEPRFKI
jgi:hypothetical protein